MLKIPIDSSHISHSEYLDKEKALIVHFQNGARYRYELVTPQTYMNFLKAPSQGRFLHQTLKNLPNRRLY